MNELNNALDLKNIQEVKDILSDRFSIIIKYFIEDLKLFIEEIKAALEESNLETIAGSTQVVKMTSKELKMNTVYSIVVGIEEIVKNFDRNDVNQADKLKDLCIKLQAESENAVLELNKLC